MSDWNKHYHWKTKGCTPWAKNYFKQNLVGKSIDDETAGQVKIDDLSSFEGDCELGNRKGKLITIYDCAISLAWSGTAKDGTEVKGTMTWPEVSHEIEDDGDEYRFETTMTTANSASTSAIYQVVRTQLAPSLLPHFHSFRSTLIETHAADLGHASPSGGSGASTPKTSTTTASTPTPSTSAPKPTPAAAASSSSSSEKKGISTTSKDVVLEARLAIEAKDLWDLLTNPAKIPMWSRTPAEFSTTPGSSFSLFGGNVYGTIISSEPPTSLVQKWRPPTWPKDHFGELKTTLNQGEDSTNLELRLSGVPMGEEDKAREALETFYIRSLKSMGLGTIL